MIFVAFGSFGQMPIGNQNKNISLKPYAQTIQFQGYPNLAEYSYVAGVVNASGGVFSTAITTTDVDNLILENTAANQWICIGKDETGTYIVSLKTSSIGSVKKITPTKTLVDVSSPFSSTAIPTLTTKIKVDISTSNIVISTTTDGVNYTNWGLLPKSAISSTYQKRIGVLNLSGNVTIYGGTLSVSNSVNTDTNGFTINGDNIKELGASTDYVLLLNSTELSGARKLKISDLFNQFGAISTEMPSNFTKIIAIGTSITAGVGASVPNNKWVTLAQQGLTDALGRSITIVNGGISGQTTSGMLTNLPALLSSNTDASVVVIEAGINDAKTTVNGGIDISITKSNLQSMITLVKNAGKIPILSTPAPLDMSNVGVSSVFDNAKRTAICFATVALAKTNNIRCADINKITAQNTDLLADGLHPNDKGHLAWANVICSEILK